MKRLNFDKTMLWRSIAGFVFCCAFILYLLFDRDFHGNEYILVLAFSLIALAYLFRIFLCLKFEKIRKDASSEEELLRVERRQDLIVSIFTNAKYFLFILLIAIFAILESIPAYVTIPLALAALLCILPLYESIRNLRRFDRQ
ncbi:MAG: hypothetical protein II002_01430 [Bacteroidales bacterium]|nr:hypothetical protein [Bacteroidales bacterium]